ncbi:uncharacterized protein [Physcomitrium patens]|uniref:Partial AB-hydrolase lipase domain-containing protein n=1 Tax=Physcomitrium patens TaxID=3218 RepID=A0A2K1IYA3_PHYPA|nr:lipase 1-like isoform X2 [Physcomitrium patens]PNR34251.1 hypothetical protein PHYPA_024068 [Physcomitrium patens]|eukprot:XP_024356464.1 lipase 1-like isoform X2 [Physcomitrella patens]
MQRLVDTVLGNAKESIKTFTQESFQNTVRVINGFSALVLAFLPGKGPTLHGIQSHCTFRAPRMPRWMEEGVSSFNTFISEYDTDSESNSENEDGSGVEDNDSTALPSPSSESSHLSRAGSSGRRHRRNKTLLQRLLIWMMWPLRFWFFILTCVWSNSGSFRRLARRFSGSREFAVPKSVADRRRGIIEDLQLVIELQIERVFEVVRYIIHHVLSPFKTFGEFIHWAFFRDTSYNDASDLADVATLGASDPVPHKQKQVPQQPLNTDNRTCQDIIRSVGYPYEAYRVKTEDGHILLLERIPRRESRKVVMLQHGILDSSLSWVSNGVVGSQAFAAFDQGYDVYLGNLRGLASREHEDEHISPQIYWSFSVNEHGTQDIPAMISKIHELKMMELQDSPHSGIQNGEISQYVDDDPKKLPYRLCGVAHSLGGAAMLIYVVTKRLANRPHYLSRLILLSPAGFHEAAPLALKLCCYVVPFSACFISLFMPGIYIPTRFFRGLFNKLSRDFQNYPALGGLAQAIFSYLIGGDSSNWVGAIGVSHYNMNNMPGVAVRVAVHLAQMMRAKRFILYDYGRRELNIQAYGTPYPLDVGANYGVIDIPVDVVGGLKDKLIPPTMVKKHFETMRSAGCQASYSEFEFAHLDFTFANREELMAYVTSRLSLVAPVPGTIIEPLEETQSSRKLTGSLSRNSFKERRLGKSSNG